jgi:glycosyltransferase involved in cell wall biosynthesis
MAKETKNAVILIPSYQPEDILTLLVRSLFDLGYKVVVVDDGGGEKYAPIFEECKQYADLISYPKNKGKGAALKIGFNFILEKYPEYGCVVTADGDGQHRILDIVAISEKALATNKSIIGVRKFDVKVPIKSKLGNGLSKFTQALCTYRYMQDNQCGLRAFPMSILPKLAKIRGNRYEYEMRVLNFLQVKEIGYLTMSVKTIYEEGNKSSHFKAIKDTLLIQGSIMLCGLVNFASFLVGLAAMILFYELFTKQYGLGYEFALLLSSPTSLVFHIVLNAIVFRPKHAPRMIFRLVLYEILILITLLITEVLFTRIIGLPYFVSYLICYPLMMFPLYYLIKGMSLVYNSQYE